MGQVRRGRRLRPGPPPRLRQPQPRRAQALPAGHADGRAGSSCQTSATRTALPRSFRCLSARASRTGRSPGITTSRTPSPRDRSPGGGLDDRSGGTLFAFRTDVLHRGSRMTGERSTRFELLADTTCGHRPGPAHRLGRPRDAARLVRDRRAGVTMDDELVAVVSAASHHGRPSSGGGFDLARAAERGTAGGALVGPTGR